MKIDSIRRHKPPDPVSPNGVKPTGGKFWLCGHVVEVVNGEVCLKPSFDSYDGSTLADALVAHAHRLMVANGVR
jgi:hypothetical protein